MAFQQESPFQKPPVLQAESDADGNAPSFGAPIVSFLYRASGGGSSKGRGGPFFL